MLTLQRINDIFSTDVVTAPSNFPSKIGRRVDGTVKPYETTATVKSDRRAFASCVSLNENPVYVIDASIVPPSTVAMNTSGQTAGSPPDMSGPSTAPKPGPIISNGAKQIASGMPCPRICSGPKRAINPTIRPPVAGTTITGRPSVFPLGERAATGIV